MYHRITLLIIVLLPISFISFSCKKEATPVTDETKATPQFKLLYVSSDLFLVNADGTATKKLTNGVSSSSPCWSPDAKKIALTASWSTASGTTRDLQVVNSDGTNMTTLSGLTTINEYNPQWSPDGSKIAFVFGSDLAVINAVGGGVVTLATDMGGSKISWSADSRRLAYSTSSNEIAVIGNDGTNKTVLTSNTAIDYNPSWSPDGSTIVFLSWRDGNKEVYVMKSDGSSQTNLTNNTSEDDEPSWSPDSKRLAFTSRRFGSKDIFVMNVDGTGLIRLTSSQLDEIQPSWHPSGSSIAYSDNSIWVVNADGTGNTKITSVTANCYVPLWSPVALE